TMLIVVVILSLAALTYYVVQKSQPPVPDIPTVSVWKTLCDNYRRVPRAKFYDTRIRPLIEQRGAVNVWNSGQWTIMVTEPSLVTQVFRHDEIFVKGGSIRRIPHSAAARLFGVNIIDSHGPLWKHFTDIIKPSIQRKFDLGRIRQQSAQLAQQLLRAQHQVDGPALGTSSGIRVENLVLRWTLIIFLDCFLDLDSDRFPLQIDALQRNFERKKKGITTPLFSAIYNIFPNLERMHWLFPNGSKGMRIADEFERILLDLAHESQAFASEEIKARRDDNKLIHRLIHARHEGHISEYHFRSNLKQVFMAGVENTDLVLGSALWELARNPQLQERARHEVVTSLPLDYSETDLDHCLPLLTSIIYETLRLYPPLVSMVNRYTSQPVCLGSDHPIPAGTWVAWHAYGTHTDPGVWGPDARDFNPDRWGADINAINEMFRYQQVKGRYIPFTSHARRCLGSRFAITNLKVALCEILRALEWEKAPGYEASLITVRVFFFRFPLESFRYTNHRIQGAVMGVTNCKLLFRERRLVEREDLQGGDTVRKLYCQTC
ncbi:cytochrome P450 monooxygenase xanG, partial [Aspergillus saccharolyticus JOP 1030-1]